MPTYRPRALAELTVPVLGTREERIRQAASTDSVTLVVDVRRATVERNDHNHADTCEIEVDWTDAGIDPRMLDDGVLTLYIDDADDSDEWEPSIANCRFIGIIKTPERSGTANEAMTVSITANDYTDLFLTAKPFGTSGIPTLEQTIEDAWRTIVAQTPGAEILAERLVLDGVAPNTVLGSAVAERFRKLSKVQTKPETDAWAVWQQCVGMLGLISFIRLDECIVTTATNLYTDSDPPVLTWGDNLDSLSETRQSSLAKKGIGLTSFNPDGGEALEAYYPPIGDERVKRKHPKAKKRKSNEPMLQLETRDFFAVPGVSTQDALDKIAQRVWEERSRQELTGKCRTGEMQVLTVSGAKFDLLSLAAGDSVRIEFDPEERQLLSALPTDGARIRYLLQRGYPEQTAELLVKNIKEFAALEPTFLTRDVSIEYEVNESGGSFWIHIGFCNRIQADGATDGAD